jgi:hypothetical protein
MASTTIPLAEDLIAKVRSYDPTMEAAWLRGVYELADAAHDGQQRASGEDYIEHPLRRRSILADMEMDRATIAAAILHDVVEDTVVTSEEVNAKFGPEIAQLVDGVTKLTRIPYQSKEDAQVENLRKMFMAMAKDIRVIIIKLADRLHNMRTLRACRREAADDRARDDRDLRADRASPGHLEDQVGSRRSLRCATSIPKRIATSPSAWRRNAPSAKRRSRTCVDCCVRSSKRSAIDADVTAGRSTSIRSTRRCRRAATSRRSTI